MSVTFLRGCAPMAVLAEVAGAEGGKLVNDRNHRRTDLFGATSERFEIEAFDLCLPGDFGCGLRRNNAEPGLDASERCLDIEILLDAVLVGEDLAHRGRSEEVAKDDGVEGGWHR